MQNHTGDSRARIPLWIQALDAATILTCALLIWDVLTARTRAGMLGYLPTVRVPFLIYTVIALAAVRHTAAPRPTLASRVRQVWSRISDRPNLGPALRIFLATRFMVFVAAYFAVAAIGFGRPSNSESSKPLADLPVRWDANWYADVALMGYDLDVNFKRESNIAFFPAFPALMSTLGPMFGSKSSLVPRAQKMVRTMWAGVVVSLCAFLVALYYFVRLASDLLGAERGIGAALLLATYPFAYFYNAPYTEALFLLCIVAAAFHFGRQEFMIAGAWGLIAGLTRPNGFLLSVPLGLLAIQRALQYRRAENNDARSRELFRLARGLSAASMPVVGMLAFTAHLYTITEVWFAWSRNQEAWGRTWTGLSPVTRGIDRLRWDGIVSVAFHYPYDTLNAFAGAFAFVLVWPIARRVGLPWAIFTVATLGLPIAAGGPLILGRLTSTLFPIFLALAAVLPQRAIPMWAAAFAIMQGLCAALFFTWRELF